MPVSTILRGSKAQRFVSLAIILSQWTLDQVPCSKWYATAYHQMIACVRACASLALGMRLIILLHILVSVHTMGELRMTGNCLKGSRAILSFDGDFEASPMLKLTKTMLSQTFNVPNKHPKSKPFFDHIFTFSHVDGRIWFRNFQV
jgi:hypothetical protein